MPSPAAAPKRWLVILAFATIYIIWGSSYLSISFAVQTLPPFVMSAARFLLAGILMLAWTLGRGAARPTAKQWRGAFIAGGLLFVLNNGMIVLAEHNGLPSGIAALLIATTPMWMVLLNWLRPGGERPGGNVFAGLALGMVGIVLLVNPGSADGVDIVGALMIIVAALCWSIGSLYARGGTLPANTALSTGMQLFAGGLMQVVLAVATGELAQFDPSQVSALSLGAMVYLAIVSSIIAFTAFSWLMRVTSPARVSTYAYVNPVVAVFLGWALNGETIQPMTILAAAVILFAVALITRGRAKPQPKPIPSMDNQELVKSVEAA
jgi:drug/metabolite transporter (DMT)-like permease